MTQQARSDTGYAAVLGLVIAALYGQFLSNPLVFDDLPFFLLSDQGNQSIDYLRFSPFALRSLPYVSLAWTKTWFGLELMPFRVGNMLLHMGVVATLYLYLKLLFSSVLAESEDGYLKPATAAFYAALLFAVHPVATYAVGYLVQRTILMATLFSLLTLNFYVLGTVRHKPLYLWATVPAFYLAVFSKEHVIMLPAVLVALTCLLHEDWIQKIKQRWILFGVLGIISLFVVIAKHSVLAIAYEPSAAEMIDSSLGLMAYPLSILTQTWLFFKYIGFWLMPNPSWMSIDMREPFALSFASLYLMAAFAFLGWGVLASRLLLKRGATGLLGLAMFLPWILFFTEFTAVRIQEIFVLYRSYLWAVGACCILPLAFVTLKTRISGFIVLAVASAMFVVSMERLMVMSEAVFLWDDAEKLVKNKDKLPGVARIYYNRGVSMLEMGNTEGAIPDLQKSVSLAPEVSDGLGTLGAAFSIKGEYPHAILLLNQAIELAGRQNRPYLEARSNRALTYSKMGDLSKAIDGYSDTLIWADKMGSTAGHTFLLGRAAVYEKQADWVRAQSDLNEACRRNAKACDRKTGVARMARKPQ